MMPVTVDEVRIEHLREPLGIGAPEPRLSWTVTSRVDEWWQAGYEVEAYRANGELLGSTGRLESDESVLVPWPFAPLDSREQVTVRARVWGSDGSASDWSMPFAVEVGLLRPDDWAARFITPHIEEPESGPRPSPLLRTEFDVRVAVKQARLYITALGVYEAYLNGATASDHVLAPGWTSYNHRLRYQTFDVTRLLREGRNALGAMVGDGWYRGRLGFGGGRPNIYGNRLALLAQLEIEYEDGTTERVVTDETWRAASGPILASDLYDGETYDARLARPGWSQPGREDSDWTGVDLVEHDLSTLEAPISPPVRRTELRRPVAITMAPSGRTILDFGQNLVGRLRLTVSGPEGQTITLRHAEVLENGELDARSLGSAHATDRYTLGGGGGETWEPRFTFHGFRYAEVDGWPGDLHADNVVAVVCHSDMERTGWFECSDPLVNRLHENVVWSMRGNFLDVPTDCPQRDERLGWTGDIQAFAPTASFLFDVSGFLASWLADLAAEQQGAGGVVPFVVPNVLTYLVPTAVWGDAAVMVPWVLYQRYGDAHVLAEQYDSMRGWVELVTELAGPGRLWDRGYQFGDWLDPAAPPNRPEAGRTDRYLVSTAYFARSAELVGMAADVLGRIDDAVRYRALAAEVRAAFNGEYVTPRGRMLSDAPTAYSLALQFALLPDEEQRRHAGDRLAALVRESRYRISTGFVGTPLICDALSGAGHHDAAYRLLLQKECPSWLYPVTMGATTIWERWDSLLPDGRANPAGMNSFNHYALGGVGDWLHRVVGGIAPGEPGYRCTEIRPRPGGGLTFARARHHTPYGAVECAWKVADGRMEVDVVVPPNARAEVTLPGTDREAVRVGSGKHAWSYPYRDPDARPPLSLGSTLGSVIDDAEAWTAVQAVLIRHVPDMANASGSMQGYSDLTLREVFGMMPGDFTELLREIEATLAEVAASR